ncbi:conjugal transfer protein, partial [Mycolicibacterium duvalii]
LGRAALHSQLAAAIQVVLHVTRDGSGRRRLGEIGLVRRDAEGVVGVLPCWRAETGLAGGAEELHRLLRSRGCA